MLVFKCLLSFLIVFLVQGAYCKPTENELTQGRGIGSTVWGWISYPFTGWWGSDGAVEAPPADDHTANVDPYYNIEIASRNLTILCNQHTCTTIKCDRKACVNTTCSIYDTDVTGQCREYNMGMKPEEPRPPIPTASVPKPTTEESVPLPQGTSSAPVTVVTESPVEHPLPLEEVMSATVTKGIAPAAPSKLGNSSPQNKI